MRIFCGIFGIVLATLAGAAPYVAMLEIQTPAELADRVLAWFMGVLPFVLVIGLPLGFAGATFLKWVGWESVLSYALSSLVLSGLSVGIIALFDPFFVVMLPGALAAGLTLGLCYWLLIRRPRLLEDIRG